MTCYLPKSAESTDTVVQQPAGQVIAIEFGESFNG